MKIDNNANTNRAVSTRTVRVSDVVVDTIVDGPGVRLAVYAQGCPHDCPGCHNPQTHDPSGGYDMTVNEILKKLNPLITGITLTGGEPLMQAEALLPLAKAAREKRLNVWLYTGYTLEQIKDAKNLEWDKLLDYTDVLVDGRFEQDKRSMDVPFRGSSNQRIIELKN